MKTSRSIRKPLNGDDKKMVSSRRSATLSLVLLCACCWWWWLKFKMVDDVITLYAHISINPGSQESCRR